MGSKRQSIQAVVNENHALKQEINKLLKHIEGMHRAGEETIDEFSRQAEEIIKNVQLDLSLALARLQQFEPNNNAVVEAILVRRSEMDVEGDDDYEAGWMNSDDYARHAAIITGRINELVSNGLPADDEAIHLAALMLKWVQQNHTANEVANRTVDEAMAPHDTFPEIAIPVDMGDESPVDVERDEYSEYEHAHPKD